MTQVRRAKPRTLDTMQFALEMLRRIPRSHPVSARELHVQLAEAGFDRDLRTVQRQLDELCSQFDAMGLQRCCEAPLSPAGV